MRLKLYKGNVIVVGRKSPYSLFDAKVASFEVRRAAGTLVPPGVMHGPPAPLGTPSFARSGGRHGAMCPM